MNNQPIDNRLDRSVFTSIREGMRVVDSNGNDIGRVREVYFGADADETQRYGAGAAENPDPSVRADNIVDDVAVAVFGDIGDEVSDEARQRLVNSGYIRLDSSGLFASDRYIVREQIAGVTEDRVRLNVSKDDLMKG